MPKVKHRYPQYEHAVLIAAAALDADPSLDPLEAFKAARQPVELQVGPHLNNRNEVIDCRNYSDLGVTFYENGRASREIDENGCYGGRTVSIPSPAPVATFASINRVKAAFPALEAGGTYIDSAGRTRVISRKDERDPFMTFRDTETFWFTSTGLVAEGRHKTSLSIVGEAPAHAAQAGEFWMTQHEALVYVYQILPGDQYPIRTNLGHFSKFGSRSNHTLHHIATAEELAQHRLVWRGKYATTGPIAPDLDNEHECINNYKLAAVSTAFNFGKRVGPVRDETWIAKDGSMAVIDSTITRKGVTIWTDHLGRKYGEEVGGMYPPVDGDHAPLLFRKTEYRVIPLGAKVGQVWCTADGGSEVIVKVNAAWDASYPINGLSDSYTASGCASQGSSVPPTLITLLANIEDCDEAFQAAVGNICQDANGKDWHITSVTSDAPYSITAVSEQVEMSWMPSGQFIGVASALDLVKTIGKRVDVTSA